MTLSISPLSTDQKRTDLSMEVVTSWSSSKLKKMDVIARVWPCSRECTAMLLWSDAGFASGWWSFGKRMSASIVVSISVPGEVLAS